VIRLDATQRPGTASPQNEVLQKAQVVDEGAAEAIRSSLQCNAVFSILSNERERPLTSARSMHAQVAPRHQDATRPQDLCPGRGPVESSANRTDCQVCSGDMVVRSRCSHLGLREAGMLHGGRESACMHDERLSSAESVGFTRRVLPL
jgi:hypothetical protein